MRAGQEIIALSAPPEITELVEKFHRSLNEYLSSCYNEEELRTEFVNPFFHVRRYAWSAGLPVSLLTDFEEFAVYDCRAEPFKTDKPAKGRLLYLQ